MVIIHGLGCAFLAPSLSRLPGSLDSLKGRAVSVRFTEGHNGNADMDNYYDEEAILRGKGHVNVLCYITGYFNDKSSYT